MHLDASMLFLWYNLWCIILNCVTDVLKKFFITLSVGLCEYIMPYYFCIIRTLALFSRNRNLQGLMKAGHLHVKTALLCLWMRGNKYKVCFWWRLRETDDRFVAVMQATWKQWCRWLDIREAVLVHSSHLLCFSLG